jgi:proteasome activator subunit 4
MDDESSDSVELTTKKRNERAQKLGFKPQQELFCNRFLPYEIDDESLEVLKSIKKNLGLAVAMREITPGVTIYISRLMK